VLTQGRFLIKEDDRSGQVRWAVVSNEKARLKVCQSLRYHQKQRRQRRRRSSLTEGSFGSDHHHDDTFSPDDFDSANGGSQDIEVAMPQKKQDPVEAESEENLCFGHPIGSFDHDDTSPDDDKDNAVLLLQDAVPVPLSTTEQRTPSLLYPPESSPIIMHDAACNQDPYKSKGNLFQSQANSLNDFLAIGVSRNNQVHQEEDLSDITSISSLFPSFNDSFGAHEDMVGGSDDTDAALERFLETMSSLSTDDNGEEDMADLDSTSVSTKLSSDDGDLSDCWI